MTHPSASPLHDAALAGDVRRLTEILDGGDVDVNLPNEYQSTALLYAAKTGQLEASALLIKRGARVDSRNSSLTTALHCASSSGHLAMCKLLVESGADPRVRDEDRDTAFDMAKEEGHEHVCEYLKAALSARAERELREAMASGDARALAMAVDQAEEEEVVAPSLISEAKQRLLSPAGPTVAERRAAAELAEAQRALAAAEAAAAKSNRAMLLAAGAATILALGVVAVVARGAGGGRRGRAM